MASIQSLGAGSGLLTSDLVEEIIAAEREATDLRLEAKRAEFEAKISAFGTIKSTLDALRGAAGALGDSDSLITKAVISSNEAAVSATATSEAATGVHTVEVLALARAHTLTTIRYDSPDEVVGEGTLDFRFGTTTFSGGSYDTFTENPERASGQVVIDSTNNTLSGIKDAINEAGIGVLASIVNDGEGYVLVLASDRTGEDHSMEITVTESGAAGLDALSFNAAASTPGTHMTQTVDADDAIVSIDGINVTRETNTIDEVVPGVTFTASANNVGFPATITVEQDSAAITDKMQAFVDAYNSVKTLTDELTDFDEEEGIGALLTGDSTVRGLLTQMRRFLTRSVAELESSTLRALVDLGISTNQDTGYLLQLDASQFRDAIAGSPNDVLALLADQRRSSDEQIIFRSFQASTVAGSYEVDISQVATQGTLNGASVAGLAGPITIDDDNDSLTVTVDGVTSGAVSLAQGVYADGDELAQEIETQINADAALSSAGTGVNVSYDSANQRLVLQSSRYGSGSSIGIEAVDTDTEAELGLAVVAASANVGQDVAGTINGIAGTGVGQFLSIPSGALPPTAGEYEAQSITGFDSPPLVVDGTNNTFALNVDGFNSGTVTLTPGNYASGADLAAEIETQINADATLAASDVSVSARFDAANKRFEITSSSVGSNSSVSMVSASAGAVADLGFAVGVGTPGKNASSVADPAAGIQIQVLGTAVGERGTVTLVRGVMNQLDRYLDEFINAGGSLANKLDSLDAQVAEINEEAADFDERMDLLEERLRIQFAAADALIATLNNTSEFLDRQLATLPGYTRKDD